MKDAPAAYATGSSDRTLDVTSSDTSNRILTALHPQNWRVFTHVFGRLSLLLAHIDLNKNAFNSFGEAEAAGR
jgi:hypothetical protein